MPYITKNRSQWRTNEYFKVTVDAANLDGHQYALPIDISLPILYYRKDLIKTPPTTWDDFLKLADQFTRSRNLKSPTLYGTTLYGRTGRAEPAQLWEEVYWPYGGQLMDAGFHSTIANAAGVKATMVGRTLVTHGDVPQPVTNYEYPQVLAALTNGSIAFAQEWNAAYPALTDKAQDPQYYNKIGFAPIPGIKVGGTIKRFYHAHTINLGVNASSKHVAAAVQVLAWLMSHNQALQYTLLGGDSPRASIFNSPAVAKLHPGFLPWLGRQIACCGRFEPKLSEMPDIDDLIMNKYLNAAWAGQMTPMAALSKAQGEINALLKKDGVQK
jgi:ABC-type glycerol-3-phosphate transport system substrate-binding protein